MNIRSWSVYVEHLPPTPPNTKPLVLFKYMPVGEDFGQVLEYLKVGLNFAKGLLFLERVDEYTSVIHVRPGIVKAVQPPMCKTFFKILKSI